MLKFKSYLMEQEMNVSYEALSRAKWLQYGGDRDRIKKLINAIKDGTPVTDTKGNDIEIANTPENIKAAEDFESSGDLTFKLKLKNGSEILSNKIGKSPYFGGKGKGGGATGATEEGESLQCIFCEAMLNEGSDKPFAHFTPELLEKYYSKVDVDVAFDKIMGAQEQWFISAYVTAKYLIDNKIINKNQVFHRGSTKMNAIYAAKTAALKAAGMPALQNDKWNPGDIWAIDKTIDPARTLNKKDIFELNKQIKDLFESKKMVGISLKQINKLTTRPKETIYNMDNVELGQHTFKDARLRKEKRGMTKFWSAKSGTLYWDTNSAADIRASTNLAAPNFEILGTGARGGKAGWQYIQYALKKWLNTELGSSISYKPDALSILKGTSKSKIDDLYNKAKVVEPSLTRDEFDEGLMQGGKIDQGFVHAKMLATYVTYAFKNSKSKAKKDAAISYIVNHASSKVDISSVYIKISA